MEPVYTLVPEAKSEEFRKGEKKTVKVYSQWDYFFYLNDLVINIISFLSIHVANAKLPHISKTDSFTFVKKKKGKNHTFPFLQFKF